MDKLMAAPYDQEQAEPAAETPERPDWLPPNFKTPEAVLESYKAAERKITEQGQLLGAIKRENATLREQLDAAAFEIARYRQGAA
jgi:hypothetical protein